MTAVIIIAILIFLIYASSGNKKPVTQKTTKVNSNKEDRPKKETTDQLVQEILKNIKITVTTSNGSNDDSIIDVTGQNYRIKPGEDLKKYNNGVPYWVHHYVYSSSEINNASSEQKLFYEIFKRNFLNNICLDLEGNTNYAFVLLFNLIDEYEIHRNISKTEEQLIRLSENYPKTKFYAYSALLKKLQQLEEFEVINSLTNKQGSFYAYRPYQSNENYNSYDNYWGIGTKYKTKLKLSDDEVSLLNKLWYPSNNFCSIEYCCLEVLKFFLVTISALKEKCIQEGNTLDGQFLAVADIIATKHFRYKSGSQNYKYCIESTTKEFYSHIFKYCENAVREHYGHKRKINTDTFYTSAEAKAEFEAKIISIVIAVLPALVSTIKQPDEATEVELYAQSTNRWKIKFEVLTTGYNEKPKEFMGSVVSLGKLNKRNPSVENIFFEASKFIAKYDKETALALYIHYLYHDLQSATFDHKQLTKTIQKNLFKTNEQLHDFEIIVSELIKDKNLKKALEGVSKIYEVKRKKIQLDTASIIEVQQQHSGTVELLNEYLKDDFEDENNTIKSQEINNEEIKIEITQKSETVNHSAFVSGLAFTEIHTATLELFAKNNFSVSQSELEIFAKSKGAFKNQLVESINDTCYEFLDDVLIEEEEDYYTISTNYFQNILSK